VGGPQRGGGGFLFYDWGGVGFVWGGWCLFGGVGFGIVGHLDFFCSGQRGRGGKLLPGGGAGFGDGDT